MYNTSLRSSVIWSSIVPSLSAPAPKGLSLREADITTHDLSVPIPKSALRTSPSRTTVSVHGNDTVHVLLLTSSDVPTSSSAIRSTQSGNHSANTGHDVLLLSRLQRFLTVTGGVNAILVFLLQASSNTPVPTSTTKTDTHTAILTWTSPIHAYTYLQTLLLLPASGSTTPSELSCLRLLPLANVKDLVPTLKAHISALSSANRPTQSCRSSHRRTAEALLSQCTAAAPAQPLSPRAMGVLKSLGTSLSDVVRVVGGLGGEAILEEAILASSNGGMGEYGMRGDSGRIKQDLMRELGGFLEFWKNEYVAE